jgi:hypothetical protein
MSGGSDDSQRAAADGPAASVHHMVQLLETKCQIQAQSLNRAHAQLYLFRTAMSLLGFDSDPTERTVLRLQIVLHDVASALGFADWAELIRSDTSHFTPQVPTQTDKSILDTLALLLETEPAPRPIVQKVAQLKHSNIESQLTKILGLASPDDIFPTVTSFVHSLEHLLHETEPESRPADAMAKSTEILSDLCEYFQTDNPRRLKTELLALNCLMGVGTESWGDAISSVSELKKEARRLRHFAKNLRATTGATTECEIVSRFERAQMDIEQLCQHCDVGSFTECLDWVAEHQRKTPELEAENRLQKQQLHTIFREMSGIFGRRLNRLSELKALTESAFLDQKSLRQLCQELQIGPTAGAVRSHISMLRDSKQRLVEREADFCATMSSVLDVNEAEFDGIEKAVVRLIDEQRECRGMLDTLRQHVSRQPVPMHSTVELVIIEIERLHQIYDLLGVRSIRGAAASNRELQNAPDPALPERVRRIEKRSKRQRRAFAAIVHRLRREGGGIN